MAQLHIKGTQLVYILTEPEGKEVDRIFNDSNIPGHMAVKIGALSFRKTEIRVIKLEEESGEDSAKFRKKFEDWLEYKKRVLAQSPEAKADSLGKGTFGLWWFAYTGGRPTEQEWQPARGIATRFYTESPSRLYPDFREWKSLFPQPIELAEVREKAVEGVSNITIHIRKAALDILERQLEEDLHWEKSYRSSVPNEKIQPIIPKDEIDVKEIPF